MKKISTDDAPEVAHEQDRSEPRTGPEPAPKRRAPRAPGQVVTCGWCGTEVPVPARGRVPKWCSSSCRHRAWEQRRAADSGRSAIEIKDRVVETTRTVTVVQHHRNPGARPLSATVRDRVRRGPQRAHRTSRHRPLPVLTPAVTALLDAMRRRGR